jgi:hypothetical protein
MLTEATGDVELVLWDGLGLVIVELFQRVAAYPPAKSGSPSLSLVYHIPTISEPLSPPIRPIVVAA